MTDEWLALLDRFERDLDVDVDLDDPAEPAPWPRPASPLPAEFAARARELVLRQQERMRRIRSDLTAVRDQLDALNRVPPARTDAPAYLDADG